MEKLITRREAAIRLRIGIRTLDALISSKILKTVKIGPRLVRIEESELNRLVEESKGQAK